jgi:hypothetical protein
MRIVIHFQVLYAIAFVSWLRAQFTEAKAESGREDRHKEEVLR